MAELLVSWVFGSLRGSRQVAPEDTTFKDFREHWKQTKEHAYSSIEDDPAVSNAVADIAEDLIVFLRHQLRAWQPRGEYKMMILLALVILGDPTVNISPNLNELPPVSHARWMVKVIYIFLMYLYRRNYQPPRGSPYIPTSISLCVVFALRVYLRYFLEAQNQFAAPRYDLELMRELQLFSEYNSEVAAEVSRKRLNHLSYLSEQWIAVALFDNCVSVDQKNNIRQNINTRPSIPENAKQYQLREVSRIYDMQLEDFATRGTLDFFDILGVDSSFLARDAAGWEEDESYLAAKDAAKGLTVVNDPAERAVAQLKHNNRKCRTEKNHRGRVHATSKSRRDITSSNKGYLLNLEQEQH